MNTYTTYYTTTPNADKNIKCNGLYHRWDVIGRTAEKTTHRNFYLLGAASQDEHNEDELLYWATKENGEYKFYADGGEEERGAMDDLEAAIWCEYNL